MSVGAETVADVEDLVARVQRLERERDLYLGLLDLGEADAPNRFMDQALGLITEILGAQRGYLELTNPADPDGEPLFIAAGCSPEQVEQIRGTVSSGIIAHAVAKGQSVSVPSALLDPRFKDRASVRRSKIEAVLCVPIGESPPLGVLYCQGRNSSGPFSAADTARAETFARHLQPLALRLFERQKSDRAPTASVRSRLKLDTVIGDSPALAHLLREVELAAPLDLSLLLTGDTGTGKSQLARVIHENSPRSTGPFVEINCAAIPEALMESELFGALPGAHSTAQVRLHGKLAAAGGGTLFLDEITELSVSAQAKLLQLLQTKQYYPLGSAKPMLADVRVIAATNVDLETAMREQDFREDLYYRLQVLPLKVPSLAERREDIPALASYFCAQASRQHGLRSMTLSPGATRALMAREWPGNIRELIHVVEVGAIRASRERADRLEECHLFGSASDRSSTGPRERLSFQEETRRFQCDLLKLVLAETDWNIAATARQLDITRAHVYNLIKAYGLSRDK
jgi:Nif-specific regulatory protein